MNKQRVGFHKIVLVFINITMQNKLVVLTTEWLPKLQRDGGYEKAINTNCSHVIE